MLLCLPPLPLSSGAYIVSCLPGGAAMQPLHHTTLFILALMLGLVSGVPCVEEECFGVEHAWRAFLSSGGTKAQMLQHLSSEVWARIAPSSIEGAGVGVEAIKGIPKGTFPFSTFHPRPAYMSQGVPFDGTAERSKNDLDRRHCHYDFELVLLPQAELMSSDVPGVAKLAGDFFGSYLVGDEYLMPVPLLGPNAFDISWYVNHASGEEANLEVRELPQCRHEVLVARRDIEQGEELTFDYSTLDMSLYFQ